MAESMDSIDGRLSTDGNSGSERFLVCALYKFVSLPDFEALREPLQEQCLALSLKGTLLLAEEGINGTISGEREAINALLSYLGRDPRFTGIDYKISEHDGQPFYRMKVRLKKEIVTLGVEGVDPNQQVGQYVEAEDWNDLISDPDVVLIDTRNQYEVEVGTFQGAVNPETESFREFPEYIRDNYDPKRHKKVAMFCTGGIRCEKASSYMLGEGFEEVYHLKGGILKYLEKVPEQESLWAGECFVFDNRVTVDHDLQSGSFEQCHACRRPISEKDMASEHYIKGVSCPRCVDEISDERRLRFSERQKQVELAARRNAEHIGAPPPSRQRKKPIK